MPFKRLCLYSSTYCKMDKEVVIFDLDGVIVDTELQNSFFGKK